MEPIYPVVDLLLSAQQALKDINVLVLLPSDDDDNLHFPQVDLSIANTVDVSQLKYGSQDQISLTADLYVDRDSYGDTLNLQQNVIDRLKSLTGLNYPFKATHYSSRILTDNSLEDRSLFHVPILMDYQVNY
ncbi:hypothetical protein [Lactiplantibacillus plantarum]|uniref:hypothetical protein n=1 Tax=Lactiplantibacillus plantarum TaxID=1590 RepID=UPI0009782B62|nr:hypothetical protein [Lactiplantibacillus plantarum]